MTSWETSTRRRVRYPESADRKSTRLNSSHANISYAVFCLKKKKENLRPGAEVSATDPPQVNVPREGRLAASRGRVAPGRVLNVALRLGRAGGRVDRATRHP